MRLTVAPILVLASLAFSGSAHAQAPLDCSVGPVTRDFGGVPWLVYACSDNSTVVAASAPGSPAMPFYFTVFKKDGRYTVVGEGTGSREATSKAYAALSKLSDAEIGALLVAAREAKGK